MSGRVLEMAAEEFEQVAARVAVHLPPSLVPVFSPAFARSHTLFDEYVYRLTLQVAAEAKIAAALGDWASADDVVARCGFEPARARVPVGWILRHLAAHGALARDDSTGTARFRVARALPSLDPVPVLEEQKRHDAACLPSYTLAESAARAYPAFLRGERSGDEVLLAPTRLPLWMRYFSSENVLYDVNNRVGAVALETWMPPGKHVVLELGGGLGSGALAVLERLQAAHRLDAIGTYRFTEFIPAFLHRAERTVRQRFGDVTAFDFTPLDMNRPFEAQGVAPGSVSAVYAVNTLHVAQDLGVTLGEVRRALTPGGQIVVSECVRPFEGQTLYPEFVFNLMETFRARGLFTPDQWAQAFRAAGFVDVRVLPDVARIREVFPTFYVAALGATNPG